VQGDEPSRSPWLAVEVGGPGGEVDVQVRCSSRSRATWSRSSTWDATCAPIQVVSGADATADSNASTRRSYVGRPARCHEARGWRLSSSSRSLKRSAGRKNAGGSPKWTSTGSPSSPASIQSSVSRGSSTSTSAPSLSRTDRPRSFQTLIPRAPRAADSRSWFVSRAGPSRSSSSDQSRWQNVAKRPGWTAS
jgi:hypothetical protein